MCDWSSQLWFLEDIPSNKHKGFQKVSSLIPDFQLESRLIHSLHVEALHSHGDFWPLQRPLAIQNQLKRGELTISIPFVSDPDILLYHFFLQLRHQESAKFTNCSSCCCSLGMDTAVMQPLMRDTPCEVTSDRHKVLFPLSIKTLCTLSQ